MNTLTKHLNRALPLLIFLPLIGCSKPSLQESLIADYVQTSDGIKTDMNFKLQELTELEEVVSNRDSLAIILNELYTDEFKRTIKEGRFTNFNISKNDIDTIISNYRDSYQLMQKYLGEYVFKIDSLESENKQLDKLKMGEMDRLLKEISIGNSLNLYLETVLKLESDSVQTANQINRFERLNEKDKKVLVRKYMVQYQIQNPMLNGAEQEISRIFLFNSQRDSILGTEKQP